MSQPTSTTRRLIVLGSTGSIGVNTLRVVEHLNALAARDNGRSPRFEVVGLAAGRNADLLIEQAKRFNVPAVALCDGDRRAAVCDALPGVTCFTGDDAALRLVESVGGATDAVAAIVGAAGLPATLAAVDAGIDVGLANKESLVVAGSLMMPLARRRGGAVIPVDSEHSAVFQALHSGRVEEVRKVYLTASGGPFRTWSADRINRATVEDALKHPTWTMGPKITIDSATMMNKALEVVEAHHLFDLPPERVEVLVHPESIVHSMVEFCDGSIIAQLGEPDMKTPIQFALTYPRRTNGLATRLDWSRARSLNFEPPDFERFPALRLGFDAARRGGTAGAVLNAANEAAVERFRAGTLSLPQIARVTEDALRRHEYNAAPTLEDLMAADAWARQEVQACIGC
jgi:1-deoxy-D-xylulose-5-phosphate reductoisomerase